MATRAEKNFEKALLDLAGENVSLALSVLTGCFVSMTLEVLRQKGHVPDGDIKIDGGDQRDITIHPPKVPPNVRNERPEASAACAGSRSIEVLGSGGNHET